MRLCIMEAAVMYIETILSCKKWLLNALQYHVEKKTQAYDIVVMFNCRADAAGESRLNASQEREVIIWWENVIKKYHQKKNSVGAKTPRGTS